MCIVYTYVRLLIKTKFFLIHLLFKLQRTISVENKFCSVHGKMYETKYLCVQQHDGLGLARSPISVCV